MAFNKTVKVVLSIIGIVAAVVLSLGVGLGIGLKKNRDDNSSQNRIEKLRSSNNFPACGVAQYENGRSAIVVTGKRKYGAAPNAQPTDPFHLGSNTKSMTATMLATCIAEGIFTWDTPISTVLQNTSIASSLDSGHAQTTLQMLTAQYSGIDTTPWQTNITFLTSLLNYSSFDGRVEYVRQVLSRPPKSTPNTTFFYDNINYMIIGLIMEVNLNTTYPDLVKSRLFDPLQMSGCGLGPLPEQSNSTINSPWPHQVKNDSARTPVPLEGYPLEARDNPPALDPAGRVYCPLASYMRYLEAHLNGSLGIPQPLTNLRQQDWRFLQTKYKDSSYTSGGWQVDTKRAGLVVHTGSNTFNFAEAFVWPEKNKIGVVVTNIGADQSTRLLNVAEPVNDIIVEMVDERLSIL